MATEYLLEAIRLKWEIVAYISDSANATNHFQ